jgi:hypothetical protein
MIARLADIERRMPDLGLLQLAAPLHDPAMPRVDVLVSRNTQWAEISTADRTTTPTAGPD